MTLTDLLYGVRRLARPLALGLAVYGCGGESNKPEGCQNDYDCREPRICVRGSCEDPTNSNNNNNQNNHQPADGSIMDDNGVEGEKGYLQISASYTHTCAVKKDNYVVCWGSSFGGSPPLEKFTQVSARADGSCGVRTDQTVECWGLDHSALEQFFSGTYTQLDASRDIVCGLHTNGSITCWIDPDHVLYYPSSISNPPSGSYSQVATGAGHVCGLRTNGTVLCWGLNQYGQTDTPEGTFTAISAGTVHTCGIRQNGAVTCWGSLEELSPSGTFTQIDSHDIACGVKSNYHVECWFTSGFTTYGEGNPPSGEFVQVGVGDNHACAITKEGEARCWGDNSYGQSSPP